MKKIALILIASLLVLLASSQHNPTPNNPWKWYTIEKDTFLMGTNFRVQQFEVSVWKYEVNNQCFEIDSLGQFTKNLHVTSISFFVYSDRNSRDCYSSYPLANFTIHIDGLPFYADPNSPGGLANSASIKEALAKRFNVSVNKIND